MRLDNSPLQVNAFVMPKAGSSARECEDSVGVDRRGMKFCVADGATEAFDSRKWARLLTKSWVRCTRPVISQEDFAAWLPIAGDRLQSQWENRQLSWYAEEKSRSGAFAAFAGLTFQAFEGELRWAAAVLGDACIFRRREAGHLQDAIPDLSGDGFERRPTLIPSKRTLQARALGEMQFRTGTAERGDVFLLLTDAIAAWYLKMRECDPARADDLELLASQPSQAMLVNLLDEERQRACLKNDDVAIIRIAYRSDGVSAGAENRQ